MELKVGITSGWEPGQVVQGWPLIYTMKNIVQIVERTGNIPYVLPVVENTALVQKMLENLDCLILAGEALSIKRNVIQEIKENVLRGSNPLRYDYEAAAVKAAVALGLPFIGICRGFQVMAVELGGKVLDSDVNVDNFIIHQQGSSFPPSKAVHSIQILENTHLRSLLGIGNAMVNSFHRQSVQQVPKEFRVSAVSDDGVIEAMEREDSGLVLGFQFHPEMLPGKVWDRLFTNWFSLVLERRR